jgi:CRP/FNR family cyclic AMP-dependent transcriptional regulator
MNRTDLHPQKHDVSGLVAAITRNKEEGTLGRFLEAHRWTILGEHLHAASLPRGHLLISQGAMDRKLYFLESGSLKVEIKTAAGFTQLAILAPGTVVGEGSFFSHLSRSSSVIAYSDCKVWELSTESFALLSKQHPTVALALSMALGAIIATRMHDMSMRIAVT